MGTRGWAGGLVDRNPHDSGLVQTPFNVVERLESQRSRHCTSIIVKGRVPPILPSDSTTHRPYRRVTLDCDRNWSLQQHGTFRILNDPHDQTNLVLDKESSRPFLSSVHTSIGVFGHTSVRTLSHRGVVYVSALKTVDMVTETEVKNNIKIFILALPVLSNFNAFEFTTHKT